MGPRRFGAGGGGAGGGGLAYLKQLALLNASSSTPVVDPALYKERPPELVPARPDPIENARRFPSAPRDRAHLRTVMAAGVQRELPPDAPGADPAVLLSTDDGERVKFEQDCEWALARSSKLAKTPRERDFPPAANGRKRGYAEVSRPNAAQEAVVSVEDVDPRVVMTLRTEKVLPEELWAEPRRSGHAKRHSVARNRRRIVMDGLVEEDGADADGGERAGESGRKGVAGEEEDSSKSESEDLEADDYGDVHGFDDDEGYDDGDSGDDQAVL
uniref:DNA-directed RNA polymerase III subunit n=1 Tax=Erythrolobus australicus TaxID=1077150 RepID=A0A7S1TK24_9RHOD|mmetsp:Transcript_2134/g.5766  ORF Transcript_2134/g.5766 Transcript_2134/m.5766 type:complete len:272 (+) Transcript_2134:68-883(+)